MGLSKIRNAVRFAVASIPALAFPLPSANFMAAKMSMTAVYPRPDVETQTHARHRLMHTGMVMRIPIGVQGGAWPFQYSIDDAPAGSTLGLYYGDTDYGILEVPLGLAGTHNFDIKVTDQDGSVIHLTWSSTVDDDAFTFLDSTTGTSGVGTIGDPLKLFSDYYLGDETDDTFANQVLVFREGAYDVVGDVGSNGNVDMNTGTKSPSWVGFPYESPVLDFSTAQVFIRGGTNTDDIFVGSLRLENARTDVNNCHFFWDTEQNDRLTWWDNYFYNLEGGINGNDNAAGVFLGSVGAREYVLHKHNTHDLFTNDGNGGYVDWYDVSYGLIEENIAKNSDCANGFWAKVTIAYVTIRANIAYDNVQRQQVTLGYGSAYDQDNHEVCWNRLRIFADDDQVRIFECANSTTGVDATNTFIYRNTFVNGSTRIRFVNPIDKPNMDSNVVISDNAITWDEDDTDITIPNIRGAEADGITDQTGLLIGSSRTTYLGIKGHEVSDNEPV